MHGILKEEGRKKLVFVFVLTKKGNKVNKIGHDSALCVRAVATCFWTS